MVSTVRGSRGRRLAALGSVVAVALALVGIGASAAGAETDYLGSGTFVACGYAVSVDVPQTCPTFDEALTAAREFGAQTGSAVVVELMPGTFCPIDIPDLADYRDLTIVGVGLAGLDPSAPTAVGGPEAGITEILDDPVHCGSWSQDLHLDGFGTYQTVTVRNVLLDGSQGAARVGIRAHVTPGGAHLFVRDVETTGFAQTGLDFGGENLYVDNSAFVRGGTGLNALGATLSVTSSTFADDDHGLALTLVDAALRNDTVVHNRVDGVSIGNSGNVVTAVNDIVGFNGEPVPLDDGGVSYVADCTGTVAGDFITTGGGHNLLGGSCRPVPAVGDVEVTADPGDLQSGGAPTDYVPTTPAAFGLGNAAYCPATDQREALRDPSATTCDSGSYQRDANQTPSLHAEPSVLELGSAPAGQTVTGSYVLSQAGGGELGVYSVVGGAGVTVPAGHDFCTHALLVPSSSASSCAVAVSMTAPAAGTTTGGIVTVTYDFGATLVLHVLVAGSGAAAPAPPVAPTGVAGTAGDTTVALRWTQPSTGTHAVSWQVQSSSDGGAHWAAAGTATTTSRTVTGLTNGVAYAFRVRAVDAAGHEGAWSATSARVTPVADASALSAPASSTVAYGTTVTLRGTLTDARTHAKLTATTVQLLTRNGTSGAWHVAASAKTNASGVVTFGHKPTGLTQYELRSTGSTTHKAVTSGTATVHVHAVVHAHATPTRVKHKHALRVYGTLAPAGSGTTIKLQRYVHGAWSTVKSAKVKRQKLPDGTTTTGYVLSYTPSSAGTLTLRVEQPATGRLSTGTSATVHVTVV